MCFQHHNTPSLFCFTAKPLHVSVAFETPEKDTDECYTADPRLPTLTDFCLETLRVKSLWSSRAWRVISHNHNKTVSYSPLKSPWLLCCCNWLLRTDCPWKELLSLKTATGIRCRKVIFYDIGKNCLLKTSGKINLNTIPLILVETTPGVTVAQQLPFHHQGLTQRLFISIFISWAKGAFSSIFIHCLGEIFFALIFGLKNGSNQQSPVCISNDFSSAALCASAVCTRAEQ